MHYFPDDKDPSESAVVEFDFSDMLSGDLITQVAVTCELFKLGGYAKATGAQEGVPPSSMLGAATVSTDGQTVLQVVTGGIDGNDYLLTCRATTASGTPTLAGKLRVRRAT